MGQDLSEADRSELGSKMITTGFGLRPWGQKRGGEGRDSGKRSTSPGSSSSQRKASPLVGQKSSLIKTSERSDLCVNESAFPLANCTGYLKILSSFLCSLIFSDEIV